jgi:hypothetical protein
MPVITLPNPLKSKDLPKEKSRKIDVATTREIANESLGIKSSDSNNLSGTLDSLGITLEDNLLELGSLAKNTKVDSVALGALRTLLELRGHLGQNKQGAVNNGVVVVISDKDKKPEEYEKIFYPETVNARSIDLKPENKEDGDEDGKSEPER